MTNELLVKALIIFLSFAGFSIAFYIHRKKTKKKPLVCPIGTSCDKVVNSEYARFLGIPVELLGMFYYGSIFITYGVFALFPQITSSLMLVGAFAVTAGAFLFSVYLLIVQAVFLKQWCTWCLFSAAISIGIFLCSLTLVQSILDIF